jgi:hypothetical protein
MVRIHYETKTRELFKTSSKITSNKVTDFWDLIQFSPVEVHRCFGRSVGYKTKPSKQPTWSSLQARSLLFPTCHCLWAMQFECVIKWLKGIDLLINTSYRQAFYRPRLIVIYHFSKDPWKLLQLTNDMVTHQEWLSFSKKFANIFTPLLDSLWSYVTNRRYSCCSLTLGAEVQSYALKVVMR